MSYFTRSNHSTSPRNLGDGLFRDVASLLVTSHLVSRSVQSLRPECSGSPELSATLDTLVATSEAGEILLQQPLADSGATLPGDIDANENALLTECFTRRPAPGAPGAQAAEVAVNLRLLAQHIELKVRHAAEEALLVGQNTLCHALMIWAAEWRACSQALRTATGRSRARAQATDLDECPALQAG